MMNIIRIFTAAFLSFGGFMLQAQQWSDVGDQGFTPNLFSISGSQHMDASIGTTTPYVVYNTTGGELAVMKYAAGIWTALPSPSTGLALFPTIRLSNTGEPYIAYTVSNSANVKKFNGTSWVQVGSANFNLALGSSTGLDCRLDFDAQNVPYVAYRGGSGNTQMTLAKFDGTAWVAVGNSNFESGSFGRLAISPANVPYVATIQVNTIEVRKFDGTSWVAVGPTTFSSTLGMLDIAVDANGVPYVLSNFSVSGNYKLTVLKFDGTTWVPVGASNFNSGSVGTKAELALDNTGVPYVTYQDASNNNVSTVMKFNGTAWVTVGGATTSPSSGQYPALFFDTNNIPYTAYHDGLVANRVSIMKLCSSTTASITSTTPGSVCGTGPVTLSVTGNGTFRWYNSAGLYIGGGASFQFLSLSSTTTISVAAYDANGCSTSRASVTATVNPLPTINSTTPSASCSGSTVSLQATPSAGVINWFASASGGSSLGSSTTFTTPVLTGSTTYYAEALNAGCASSSRTAVLATINPLPTAPTAVISGRCGPGIQTISVTADPGTVNWFSVPSGGTSLQTGTSYTTPGLTTATTYYASFTNTLGCTSANRTPVTANIFGFPTITATTPANRCGGGTVTLSAATSGDASAQWFTDATGGTALSTLKTFVTPSISATTTYYVEALENGCPSNSRTAVVATINPIPTITTSDGSRCGDGTVTLAASSDGDISWFATNTGGTALTTGTNFTTPALTATTSYFLESILNGCTTPTRTSISAAINPIPAMPTISANNTNPEVPILTSSSSNGNQWFKDDVIISGANSNTYTIAQAGTYKVQVTLLGCSSPISDGLAYVITGVEEFSSGSVQFYPNPAREELVVNLKAFEINKPVTITVMDLLGRMHYNASANGGDQARIDIRTYPSGNYVLLLQQGKSRVSKTFIKSF
jgi:hypothetical protein